MSMPEGVGRRIEIVERYQACEAKTQDDPLADAHQTFVLRPSAKE